MTRKIFNNIQGIFIHERIIFDQAICHGQACIKGTRIPVHQILDMLANGDSIEVLLKQFPNLQKEDVLASIDYAATLAEEYVTPLEVTHS